MGARTAIGVVMSILGLLLLLFSGYELNSLFFIDKLATVADIPSYSVNVVMPFLLGIMALLDGSIILGLKRSFSLSIHLLVNFVWLYAAYMLYDNLAIPITDITAYHQVFLLGFLGLILFVVGVIANDIPKRKTT